MPQFAGLTMTPNGPLLSWSYPDGTVRIAMLVWRDATRDGDTIQPAHWTAIPHAVVDPSAIFPETDERGACPACGALTSAQIVQVFPRAD